MTKSYRNKKHGGCGPMIGGCGPMIGGDCSGGGADRYERMDGDKYKKRKAPLYHATEYCDQYMPNDDGVIYYSKQMSNGCRWVKTSLSTSRRKTSRRKTARRKTARRKSSSRRKTVSRRKTARRRSARRKSSSRRKTARRRSSRRKSSSRRRKTTKQAKTINSDTSKQTTGTYITRNSPPYHASAYCGKNKKGNDGNLYFSKQMPNGSCRWVKN